METLLQDSFTEPDEDPGVDEPLVVHQHRAGSRHEMIAVFVHGLGGSRYGRKATWGKFPAFLFADLPNLDVGMYSYRTLFQRLRFRRSVDLETEARIFADAIRDLKTYTKIILIGHSMGGLLCKGAICRLLSSNQIGVIARLRALILMATPQLGSLRVPRFLWGWTADFRALRPHGRYVTEITEIFQNRLNNDVGATIAGRIPLPAYSVCAASDQWVDRLSAGINISAAQTKTVRGSHTSIVKPPSKNTDAYVFVKERIEESLQRPAAPLAALAAAVPPPAPAAPVANRRYRVIAFDLDGTLIRGLEFSWTRVWQHLKFPKSVQKTGMLRYRRQQTSYQEWCEWACKLYQGEHLKRADFAQIVAGLTVTNNLHEAIKVLKADGFVTAIISGGIDVFLQELIPDADQLFDYIFINHLKFDAQGFLSGVDSTPYDFEGKATALEKICKERGYSLEQSVFVGEGFNDEFVADKAGLAIAYPPRSQGFQARAGIEITEDDLMKVVEQVLK